MTQVPRSGSPTIVESGDEQYFLAKALESLQGAESELANKRYNNAANRAYYACP